MVEVFNALVRSLNNLQDGRIWSRLIGPAVVALLVWLLLAFVLTLVHPFVPESRWLMVHVVLLGAVTHSILVWSTHFAQALLKTSEDLDPRRNQSLRLGLLMLGILAVLREMHRIERALSRSAPICPAFRNPRSSR